MKSLFRLSFVILVLIVARDIHSQSITTASVSFVLEFDNSDLNSDWHLSLFNEDLGISYVRSIDEEFFHFSNLPIGPYQLRIEDGDTNSTIYPSFSVHAGDNNLGTISIELINRELEEIAITASNVSRQTHSPGSLTTNEVEIQSRPFPQRSILDFGSLHPLANGSGFGGKGPRDNFVSIDGLSFNNSYGIGGPLATLVGNVVDAQPISLDAIEEIQFNLSPFDVRLSGFTGSAIQVATKSGRNDFSASAYTYYRNNSLVNGQVGNEELPITEFDNFIYGFWAGGAIRKNKLFYSLSYEKVTNHSPASNFLAARAGLNGSNITRVSAEDLEDLSDFLLDEHGYETGSYENYNLQTTNDKLFIRLDWFPGQKHHAYIKYTMLDASKETPNTNSGLFGSGQRMNNPFSMSYESSGSRRIARIQSVSAECKSYLNRNTTNRLAIGYSYFPDHREIVGRLFPSVDILQGGRTYISFGSHLFASSNRIDQKIFNVQNDYIMDHSGHTLILGASFERSNYQYEFIPAEGGSFVFDSMEDFYHSQPIGTTTPLGLSNGLGRPSTFSIQYPLSINQSNSIGDPTFTLASGYVQENLRFTNLEISAGLRLEYSYFSNHPPSNDIVSGLEFQNADGSSETLSTDELPDHLITLSPRFGFDWNIGGLNRIYISGGIGIFAGRTPLIRIGDQYVNNGLSQGLIRARNNAALRYPFNSDPHAYIPDNNSGSQSFDLNVTNKDFQFPRSLKTALKVAYQLTESLNIYGNILYSKDLKRDLVRNANLDALNSTIDENGRFIYGSSRLHNPPISGAYVLDNTSEGYQLFTTVGIQKQFSENWEGGVSYSRGVSKDVSSFSASSARVEYRSLPSSGNSNKPPLSYSDHDQPHRLVGSGSFKWKQGDRSSTQLGLFINWVQNGRFSYMYGGRGDINNDGIPNNDLLYIPVDQDDISLQGYRAGGQMITPAQQWAALDQFIEQSDYLKSKRGSIVERNGHIAPARFTADLRILQEFHLTKSENPQRLQLSIDIINLTNLINNSWGLLQLPASLRPIQYDGQNQYRVNPSLLQSEFVNEIGVISRWQMQLGLRYIFN